MTRGLELLIAQTILQGFDAQYGRFLEVTSGAQQRFEHADWHAVQQAMKQRIHLYDHHVGLVVEQLRCITEGKSTDVDFLLRVKEQYTHLLPDYPRFEIAESFFNSVYCRLFDHRSLTPERLFIFSSQPERSFRSLPRPLAKDFFPDRGWEHAVKQSSHRSTAASAVAKQGARYRLYQRQPAGGAGRDAIPLPPADRERTVLPQ
jgi:isocitrate dehydrogenase kinase/phosphatase